LWPLSVPEGAGWNQQRVDGVGHVNAIPLRNLLPGIIAGQFCDFLEERLQRTASGACFFDAVLR
jgi:hypothetical protein